MKTRIIVIFILLFGYQAFAQQTVINNLRAHYATGLVEVRGIGEDVQGNLYYANNFTNYINIDSGVTNQSFYGFGIANDHDIVISKTTPSGTLLWAKQIGGIRQEYVTDFSVDDNGNIYSCGTYGSLICDFDPGPGTAIAPAAAIIDIYILKLDSAGIFQWVKTINSPNYDYVTSLAIDSNNDVVVGGFFESTIDFDPGPAVFNMTSTVPGNGYLLKLDGVNGNFIWAKQFVGGNTDVREIDFDSHNNMYLSGHFFNTVDFDLGVGTNQLTATGASALTYIAKYDGNADLLWVKTIGNSFRYPWVWCAELYNDSVYAIGGHFRGFTDFDPGANFNQLNSTGNNVDDGFIATYDSAGNYRWANKFTGPARNVVMDIKFFPNGDVLSTGSFSDSCDFNPSTTQQNWEYSSFLNLNMFISRLDNAGNYLSSRAANILNIGSCGGTLLHVYDSLSYQVIGGFSNNVNFDISAPSTASNTLSSTGTAQDVFLLSLNLCNNSSSQLNITACDSIQNPSQTSWWTSSGIYYDTILNATGCDSFMTINLTLNTSSADSINATVCGTYISPSTNYTWSASGIYTDTIANAVGCDSIITIDLTVNNSSSTISPVACDSYTSPSGNTTWTNSGTYNDTIPNTNNCDSTITINLTINNTDSTITQSGTTLTAQASNASYQWIDCNNNNQPIVGETAQSFTATVIGNYAVIVTENNCTDTSQCIAILTIGVTDYQNNSVKVYPNPTQETVQIELDKQHKNVLIEVMDISGRVIQLKSYKTLDKVKLDIKEANGIYLLKVSADNLSPQFIKVIKE